MKQLSCEMCGSTDLLKTDGVFVCQNCGCKYSVEEAKKMMVEGVVQVEGTVKVDKTAQIENYLTMAQEANSAGNSEEAESYANKVLEIDPNDWRALLIKGAAVGWQSTIQNNRIPEAYDIFSRVIYNCGFDNLKQTIEAIEASASALSLAMLKSYCNRYASFPSKQNATDLLDERNASYSRWLTLTEQSGVLPKTFPERERKLLVGAAVDGWQTIWKDYTGGKELPPFDKDGNSSYCISNDRLKYACPSYSEWDRFLNRVDACTMLLKAAIKDDPKFSESNATIYGNLIFIIEKALPTCSVSLYPGNQPGSYVWRREYNLTDEAKKSQETRITLWKARKLLCERQVREAAADEYWSEHPQEKATLLQKKAETEAAISQKKENDTYLTAKRKFEEIGEEIDDLGASIGNCGLFENKKRKELRSQVIAKQNELKPHKDTMETFDNEIKALNETLEELNKKLLNPEV